MLKRTSSICLAVITATSLAQTNLPVAPSRPLILAVQANSAPASSSSDAKPLTRQEAEQLALRNNPRITVAQLLSLAQKQVVRETRSANLPSLNGEANITGAEEGTRISGDGLTASRLLNHAGVGVGLTQLVTDFGRTHNLIASSTLHAKAADQNAEATREDIVLAVDLAFYAALEAQATLDVAHSTVNARQSVSDQVSALTASKLKSTLDQSFAEVNLSQARLLLLDAQDQSDAALAQLSQVLGYNSVQPYTLVDDSDPLPELASSADSLIALALQQRPDLQAQRYAHEADVKFSRAQYEQLFPTVSGGGIVGSTPIGSPTYFNKDWYGAVGANLNIPLFNGFRFTAEAKEAGLRAKASDAVTRQLVDVISRDVRVAWLTANTAQQRMKVTHQLLQEANTALDLARTRYNLGLSSIVELSQAQLQQTQAQIDDANARFQFEADTASIRFQTGTQP